MNSERQPWWGWLLVVLVPLAILLAGPVAGWRDAYLQVWYQAGYAAGLRSCRGWARDRSEELLCHDAVAPYC